MWRWRSGWSPRCSPPEALRNGLTAPPIGVASSAMTGRAARSPLAAVALVLLAASGCGGGGSSGGADRRAEEPPAAPLRDSSPSTPQDELQSRRPVGVLYMHRRCTPARPCRFVVRLGATASQHRFIAWDTPQRYEHGAPIFIQAWADEQPVPFQPMGSPVCGLHFMLRAVVVGVASFCQEGHQPIHFQFTNVTEHPVTVTLGYYTIGRATPAPPIPPARPAPVPAPAPAPSAPKPPTVGPFSPL